MLRGFYSCLTERAHRRLGGESVTLLLLQPSPSVRASGAAAPETLSTLSEPPLILPGTVAQGAAASDAFALGDFEAAGFSQRALGRLRALEAKGIALTPPVLEKLGSTLRARAAAHPRAGPPGTFSEPSCRHPRAGLGPPARRRRPGGRRARRGAHIARRRPHRALRAARRRRPLAADRPHAVAHADRRRVDETAANGALGGGVAGGGTSGHSPALRRLGELCGHARRDARAPVRASAVTPVVRTRP